MFKLNKKGQKALNKSFAFLSIVSLVLQSLSGIFFLTPSYAQSTEETSAPTAIPTIEAAIITSTPEVASTPTTEVAITPVTVVTEPPVLSVTPTTTPEETKPEVLAVSLPQEQSPPSGENLLPSGTDQTSAQLQPSVSTDKNDYFPAETAIISGKDLKPNTTYKIIITSETDNYLFEENLTTGETGAFTYSYRLENTYRPNYKVEIKEGDEIVASTTFTDGVCNDQGVACGNDGQCCVGLTCQGAGSDKTCQTAPVTTPTPTLTPTPTPTSIPVTPSATQTIEDSCMEVAYGGGLNCSAKDISLSNITEADITILDDGCTSPTDTVTFKAIWNVQSQADQRYNVGLYFAADGQDNALTGICSVSTLPNSPIPPWYDYDGNACGDINADTVLHPEITMTVQCSDPDGDNTLNMPYCTSWHQQVYACSTPVDAVPLNPAKCNCDPGFQIPIFVPSGNLTVIKHVVNDGGGTKIASDFTINVTGINPSISSFLGQEAPGTSVVVDAGAYSVDEVELPHYQKSLSAGCFGTMTAGGGAVCTITNTYIPYCGDGVVGVGEECEGSETRSCQTTSGYNGIQTCSQCQWGSCEPTEWCGDGIVNDNEECDGTAGVTEHNVCTSSCTLEYVPYCGDGITDINLGEQCDDGNTDETDGCDNSCRALGSISGVKFQDNDGDGNAKEVDESGLSGWTIEVIDLAGALIGSAVTGTDGSYAIPNLLEGTYNVCEVTQPTEWTRTYPGNNCYSGIVLNPGSNLSGYDFGNFQNIDIKVCKEIDTDGNGQGDTPYTAGWLMTLIKNGQTYGSQNTGADGCYTWTNLEPGSYSVSEETKTGWTPTGATTYDFGTVLSGQPYQHTFGNFENVSVTACKLADADGLIGTVGDRGSVSDWPVYLTIDSVRQALQKTSTNGCYTWTNLGPGHSYGIEEDVTTGWTALTPTSHVLGTPTSGNTGYKYDFINTSLGGITIEKQTLPSDSQQNFNFTPSYGASFNLVDNNQNNSGYLMPGTYTVTESALGGWDLTNLDCDDTDSVEDLATKTATIYLQAGETVKCTFTNTQRSGITIVKNTIGGDGNFSFSSNFGVSSLITSSNTASQTVSNLVPGTYNISENVPLGWDLTGSSCSDGSQINSIDLSAGESLTCTFANTKRGSISGIKFEDFNANAIRDAEDVGLEDWTIQLYQMPSQFVTETTTISDGTYSFNNLVPSWYYVCEVPQAGWQRILPGLGDCYSGFQVTPGSSVSGIDFGNYKLGSISGLKFEDVNGNGVKDAGDSGLSGWTIFLDLNANGSLDAGEPTQVTASDGSYSFTNLTRGQYHGGYSIREVLQPGWVQTVPENSYWISTPSGTDEDNKDFGNFKLGKINACKYEDVNGNGLQESEDTALSGISMILYKQDTGGSWISLGTQETLGDGCTLFSDLTYGQYRVSEDYSDPDLTGFYPTNGDTYRDYTITSGSNETATFLNSKYRTISGQKFEDINGDSIKDAGELGLPGWTIFIDYNEDGKPSLGEPATTTDENGNYQFTGLVSDWYRVAEDLQSGWLQTLPAVGYYGVELHSEYSAQNVDFGNYQYGRILVCKYDDLNGDGQLGKEPTIAGVQMDLYEWVFGGFDLFRGVDSWIFRKSQNSEENGCTLFDNLLSGNYRVRENIPTGYYQTYPLNPPFHNDILIQSGTDLTFNFLNASYGSIGDTIYEDLNNNQTQDGGELGIDGITVYLYFDNDGDGTVEPNADDGGSIATEITNGSGVYLFPNLIAGAYLVDVDETTLPVGYSLTTANDPAPVALTPGTFYDLADFGYKPIPPSIELNKTNNKSGGASASDVVTYTLILINGLIPLTNIEVKDSLPFGFSYIVGSTTGASEPLVSGNILKWTIASLGTGATATISYQAKIDGGQQAGKYYNLATCRASTSRGEIGNETLVARITQIEEIVNCNLASSEVPIGQPFSYSATIGGSVLGVSTVLGAATGSETYWLIMAIIMMVSGLFLANKKRFVK